MPWKKRILIALSANMGTSLGDDKFGVSGGKVDLEWCEYGVQGLNRVSVNEYYDTFQS